MGQKVTFDPVTKLVQVTTPPVLVDGEWVVDLDIKIDLYSDGKEDWLVDDSLNKFIYPVSSVGGNPLPGSKELGSTFFLEPPWFLKPYNSSHTLRVNGNFYRTDGVSPFVPTDDAHTVMVVQTVSSLVDSTVQQLQEIEYASFNGGVTYNKLEGFAGIDYPIGTPQKPSDNIDDTYEIAEERGFPSIYVIGDIDLTDALPDLKGYSFIGSGKDRTHITIAANANVEDCAYYDAHVIGTLDGNSKLSDCVIDNLIYVKGYIESCVLAPGTIVLAGSEEAHFLDCWSGQPGVGTPTIDMGGSGQALALRNYNGGIKLINKTGPESVSIDLNSGQVQLEMASMTNGTIVVRGVGKLIDSITGEHIYSGVYGNLTILNELVSTKSTAKEVWDSLLIDFLSPGSFGYYVQKKLLTVSKFLGLK